MEMVKELKKIRLNIFLMFLIVVCFSINGDAEIPRVQHPATKSDGSITALVVGDWGRRGTHNQSHVALQMGVVGEELDIDFVISTGDNFYDSGLTDVFDPAFDDSFTNIYTSPSLQKQWYNVLGNHDYRGNALAQLSPILTARDSRWICLRSYVLNSEIVDFIFIDTTPFQDKYFTDPEDHVYDWRGILPRETYLSTLLKEVESALRESRGKWKIVVGHHTIRSAGQHGDTTELVSQLLPILQANNVHLYMNGHDHCLQHISSPDNEIQFVTSGGGSKAWRGDVNTAYNKKEMKFYYDGQGFITLQITPSQLHISFYDIHGYVLHQWTTSSSKTPLHSIL